nr:hypothetical protein [Herbaspirillum sp. B39]
MRNISKPAKDGSYFKEVLTRESTVHVSFARADQSETIASLMQQIGKQAKGKDHPPMIMGLWDAVGIVHELNGYRNEVVGWSEKYVDELEQHVSAMMTIDGLREVLGDAIMRRFRIDSALDYGGEKMIQHLLSIRALVDPADSLQLIRVQSKEEGIARQQTMERLRTARTFLVEDKPEMRTVQAEKLRAAWEGFKNSGTHTNAVKDIRLNLLVMFIEGGNFAKMMGEFMKKNDKKSWLALAASGMTITAGLFDITATLVKGIAQDAAGDFDKGASLWSYQRLKLAGGLLSAGGSAIGAYLDYEEYSKASHRERSSLAALYGLKFAGGAANAIISLATALTYSTPYIRHLTSTSVLILTAKKVGQKEIPFIVARGLLMTMGGSLSIALFGLQVLIWIFDEDELQIWCSLCPFGEKRDTPAGYASHREQMLALNKALVELALAPPAKEEDSQKAWGALEDPTLEELRMYF